MSSELITAAVPPTVADVTGDLHLVAKSAAEMQQAQTALVAWFRSKLEICNRDVAEAEANLSIATEQGFKRPGFVSALGKARKRVVFYEKLAAAVEAGYAIVPNFPVELFAIRTTRSPARVVSEWRGGAEGQRPSEGPALGDGAWVDSRPISLKEIRRDDNDPTKFSRRYITVDWQDEIEFPVSIARPEIMSAAAEAMAANCFDELGVLPQTGKRKGDPILVGRIRKPGNVDAVVTFMIAWYVNPADL